MYAGSIVYMFHCSHSWEVGVICSSEVHLGIRDQLYTKELLSAQLRLCLH